MRCQRRLSRDECDVNRPWKRSECCQHIATGCWDSYSLNPIRCSALKHTSKQRLRAQHAPGKLLRAARIPGTCGGVVGAQDGAEEAALDQLKVWMAAEGLSSDAAPVYGYFDPPWTPAFLRRNEVMLQVATDR